MKPINQVMLSGNLGRDPEARYTADGSLVVTLALAFHGRKKQGDEYIEETDWYTVSVWGSLAEWATATLGKGSGIIVGGKLRQSKWVDATTQQNRVKVELVANDIYLLPRAGEDHEEIRTGVNEEQESPDEVPAAVVAVQPMKVTQFPQQSVPPRRPQGPPSRPVPKRIVEDDEDIPF